MEGGGGDRQEAVSGWGRGTGETTLPREHHARRCSQPIFSRPRPRASHGGPQVEGGDGMHAEARQFGMQSALGRPRPEGHRWWLVHPGRGQQGLLELWPWGSSLGENRKGGTQPGAALVIGVLAIQWGDRPHVVNT